MMIVVMGVSGSGKSSVGAALARALGTAFLEGDTLHPAANVARMAAGTPLDDADRAPWLSAIAAWMGEHGDGVVACSALKRAYRDRLREAAPALRLVALLPPDRVLADRVGHRRGHFMPGSLLASQLATLEPPQPDEDALVLTADETVDQAVVQIGHWFDPSIRARRFGA